LVQFSHAKNFTIPVTSHIYDLDKLRSVEAVLVVKKGFDSACVLKNNLEIDKKVEFIYAGFETLGNLLTLQA